MFICDKDLKENFINHPSLCKSFGRCEWCGKITNCNDISSKNLESRRVKVNDEGLITEDGKPVGKVTWGSNVPEVRQMVRDLGTKWRTKALVYGLEVFDDDEEEL